MCLPEKVTFRTGITRKEEIRNEERSALSTISDNFIGHERKF